MTAADDFLYGPDAPGDGPDGLRARWVRALTEARAGARRDAAGHRDPSPEPDPLPYAENLLARWSEPQRRYHTTDHLAAVLDRVDLLADRAADPDLVRLAAWFHDAVYRPDRSENEERSAGLAERALPEAGLSAAATAEVARLVRLTVSHAPEPGDANGAVLCDADLAILASPPAAYRAYARAVREEYAFVPDDAFRQGRAEVLRRLLGLPRLFHTPYGAREWETAARANLTAELARLA
ncbi:HD domain-containing protein [Streptomyces qinzhouensis]|uniref:Metal-dependent phosphohydrolase n=1 Tax=Streptomyces qinzhouensis TaxID=2599401 RepID=A0A5B8J7X3_9ACTN|nr:hypothetical protein [Streptomyces qinzhouensis]QDY77457.1 hypothetical protein FQU76_14020 [Streptomyces qinzhouensis]